MDFFEQQEKARKNTRWLIVLFGIAIFSLIVLTNVFLILFPWELNAKAFSEDGSNQSLVCLLHRHCDLFSTLNWRRIVFISVLVPMIILLVSLWKWFSIRQGGKKVAQIMGARQVLVGTQSLQEKRLINVVEEMALAANMPVPAVYVLDNEHGINAFAAGFSQKDAIVAVTAGTLASFNRDQLQGVIAHEFSHILNGDMRLNMHLIAVLHGIMFITESGMVFLRGGSLSSRNNRGPTMILGLGLVVLGALGTLFGQMIKAAVSRQREFLADASAVQFSRNPHGIADALKIIGGVQGESIIVNAHKTEVSHLFFARCSAWSHAVFSTHPPLAERIQRVQPSWNGDYLQPGFSGQYNAETGRYDFDYGQNTSKKSGADDKQAALSTMMTAVMLASPETETENANHKDTELTDLQLLHTPLGAASALCCFLLPTEEDQQQAALGHIKTHWPELSLAIKISPWRKSSREDFLDILEVAVSALRELSAEQYTQYKQLLIYLIKLDGQIELYEWALYYSLRAQLDSHFDQAQRSRQKFRSIKQVETQAIQVLAKLIHSTEQSEDEKMQAFARALNSCGIYTLQTTLPEVNIAVFNTAIRKLTQAYPLVKSRFIKALVDAAIMDGNIEPIEKQTVLAIAAAIDSPLSSVAISQMSC